MKQRIDISQLQELTPEQRVELKRWWKPQQFDVFVFGGCGTSVVTAGLDMNGILWGTGGGFKLEDCTPLLSVGQCIEYLEQKDPGRLCMLMCYLYSSQWLHHPLDQSAQKKRLGPVEIIDALWTEIKAVLLCNQPKEQTKQANG